MHVRRLLIYPDDLDHGLSYVCREHPSAQGYSSRCPVAERRSRLPYPPLLTTKTEAECMRLHDSP